jgi:Ca2+-binding EF-hand superfamily protein
MKDKKAKDDQSTASNARKGNRFRFFGGKRNKNVSALSPKAMNGKGSNDSIPDFQLDAVGKEKFNSPIRQQQRNVQQPSNLIPLVPLHDALTIDNAPIGRAAEAASLAGSRASSRQRATTGANTTSTTAISRSKTRKTDRSWLSWICRTRYFSNLCDTVFDAIDSDRSNAVDKNELYQGLLLIHLKLGTYAGPAACKPLSRERCNDVFMKMDDDKSGFLDKAEFREVMMVLFGNVFLRVIVQWYMTIIFVPLLANYIVTQSGVVFELMTEFVLNSEEYSVIRNTIELSFEDRNYVAEVFEKLHPIVQTSAHQVQTAFQSIPESVWDSIPLTLVSSILGLVAVPYVIFKVDDFFTWLGDLRTKKMR